MAYTWLTYAQAKQQLAQRLAEADQAGRFWIDDELGQYIVEALRVWNALTFTWKTSFVFTVAAASQPVWRSLGGMTGSPRLRSVTDTALYTLTEYHLLEPATGGTWTGTSQFSIADLSTALSRCLNEAIQITNCNLVKINPIATTPGDFFIPIPDSVLDIPRARWIPDPTSGELPTTLMRNDNTGLNYYEPGYTTEPWGTPTQYNIASLPPLVMQVDVPPVNEGSYDLLGLISGGTLNPPNASVLPVPNDNAWMLKWGMIADLLGRESEATDTIRAQWCTKAYSMGLKLLTGTPWIMQAYINGIPADMVSVTEMDQYFVEWDSAPPDYSTIITSGVDLFTVVPDPAADMSITLNVLGNAPVPTADGDFIQCARDVWDSVLDYAQFLAAFKQGGAEFLSSTSLFDGFVTAAMAANDRLEKLGLFADEFNAEGSREIRVQERYTNAIGGGDGGS
ncbi:MAG TPA: hypothetical protein VK638_12245 [Edaphobacter sp.]|nr:hypothetical protein [Edaphobacter sp.]